MSKKDDKSNKNVPLADESCTHDCSSCSLNCDSRKSESLAADFNPLSSVKHCIGVISGKGGVGKSLVTAMSAVIASRKSYKTAILDADVTGPSIPKIFGLKGEVTGADGGMYPLKTKTGIEVMSVNLLLEHETQPVIWRGPIIAGVVKQFWTDVIWGDIDYMYVDMPPGTGDVPLTVFQSLKLDGVIIVTTPQELVSMIVEKAYNMAKMMNIPVLGIIENMSYAVCPDCGHEIKVFGESNIEKVAEKFNLDVLRRIPLDPKLAALCDKGMLELMENDYLDRAAEIIEKRMK